MSLFFKPDEVASYMKGIPEEALKNRHVFLDDKNIFSNNSAASSEALRKGFNNSIGFPPTVIKDAFQTKAAINKDIVYENAKPVHTVLRLMGVFPFMRPQPGVTLFARGTPSMAYSAVVYLVLMVYIIYVAINRVNVVRTLEGRFEEAVIAYLFIVNLLPCIMIPILWAETGKVATVLNSWSEFEMLYSKVAGRELGLKLRTKSLVVAILLPMLSTASVIVTHITMIHFRVEHVMPYIFLDTLIYMMGAYWYFVCQILSEAASILAEDFQRALRHIGPAAMVSNYRALWLRLSKLARNSGTATCYTFTFISLYLFLILTLSIYGLLSQLSEGFGVKDIGLAVTAFCSIGLLFVICDEAHYASYNVKTNFQKKLLMVELSWMNTDAQSEINMFLRATEMNPSNINLGGFFDVNRNLFKSLLATMVTYLVVLLQFQISIPDDPSALLQSNGNGTSTAAGLKT